MTPMQRAILALLTLSTICARKGNLPRARRYADRAHELYWQHKEASHVT